MRTPTPLADRFWAKVDASGDCWEWMASTTGAGYGQINLGRRGEGMAPAHRVAYKLLVGDPGDLHLDHLCRNKTCVNPDHLEPVTFQENVSRGRPRWGGACKRGHPLTPDNTAPNGGGCRTCQRWRDANRTS